MDRQTRRRVLRGGTAVAVGSLAGCLNVLGGADGSDDAPNLPPPHLGTDSPDAADVVVVVWMDFRCPHCATFHRQALTQVRTNLLGDGVRLEHRDFPVPVDQWSWRVAMAARSVQERAGVEAFWTFADRAFARQSSMNDETAVREVAAAAEADPDVVLEDLRSGRHRPVVEADRAAGRDAGVAGTPTVFVDGERVEPIYPAIVDAVQEPS